MGKTIPQNAATPAPAPRVPRGRAPKPRGAEKTVNLRSIAREANVSVATVSMVLNGNPRISRSTQLRVQRVINELGYQPNRLAQGLASDYTRTLAVLLPVLRHVMADEYFGELISGICDRASELDHKIMLEQATPAFVGERRHLELVKRRFVDGILCLGFHDDHQFLGDFEGERCPMLMVNNYVGQRKLDALLCDYRGGAEQVMNYLLQLGHRRIGFINGSSHVATAREVGEVYEQKLRSAGIDPDPAWCDDGQFTEVDGAAAAERILRRAPDVTAVFAGNDKMALGAMHFFGRHGIRVPHDVSVVGFDDLRVAAFTSPALTTVHLPLYELGRLACERLIDRVHGGAGREARRLPTHLVVRESTAMAPDLTPAAEPRSAAGSAAGAASPAGGPVAAARASFGRA